MTISISHKQCNGNDIFKVNALCLIAITMYISRFKAKFLSTTYLKMETKLSLWTYSINNLRSKAKCCYIASHFSQ